MGDHVVVMAVGSYGSGAAARRDFDIVGCTKCRGELDHVVAAMLQKGIDGRLVLERHDSIGRSVALGAGLLGAALTVIAAPLGIQSLAGTFATPPAWFGVAGLVAHLWHDIPKDELLQMSNLLEARQAALLVVALDHTTEGVRVLLSNAEIAIVADPTSFDADALVNAVDQAGPRG